MRVACWQASSPDGGPPEAVLTKLASTAGRAAEMGVELLVAPELTITGYPIDADYAWDGIDESAEIVAGIAKSAGLAVCYGLPTRDGTAVYNEARIVDGDGRELTTYRKTHLFREFDLPVFTPGDGLIAQTELGGTTVGLAICYDVEFPELVRAHALAGTELLVVPTALMSPAEFVASTLVPARAFESQLYIAYVNWCGRAGEHHYCGMTRIVDPHGRLTAAATTTDDELVVAELRPAEVLAARDATTYLRDLRPELYAGASGAEGHGMPQ